MSRTPLGHRLGVILILLLGQTMFLAACGGGAPPGTTIRGMVTAVDLDAKTFSVDSRGTSYDFQLVQSSRADIREIQDHLVRRREIEVRYRGEGSSPYEVIFAD